MDCINDRVVNVPISDDDVVKQVNALPRTQENDGTINLKMKRKMEYKTYYKAEAVRPKAIYDALRYLKEHHPEYKNMKILPYEEFMKSVKPDGQESSSESDDDSDYTNIDEEDKDQSKEKIKLYFWQSG